MDTPTKPTSANDAPMIRLSVIVWAAIVSLVTVGTVASVTVTAAARQGASALRWRCSGDRCRRGAGEGLPRPVSGSPYGPFGESDCAAGAV